MLELPFWIKSIVLTLGLPLMAEIGFRLHGFLRHQKRPVESERSREQMTQFVVGAMALLSLVLAFSVSGAAERFELRRELVATEASEITTTYLRAQLFPAPVNARLGHLLAKYVDDRQKMIAAFGSTAEETRWGRIVELDQKQLWEMTTEALGTTQSEALKVMLLDSMNGLLDNAGYTYSIMELTTPKKITLIIFVFSFWTAGLVGYQLGAIGKRYPLLSTAILLMFAWTAMLIEDLDRPGAGFIGVSTEPLQRASDWIARSEAASSEVKAETKPASGAVGTVAR